MKKHSSSKKTRRGASTQDLSKEVLVRVGKALDNLNAGATIYSRRLTTSGSIVSSAGGLIALGTLCSSSAVNSAPDFASVANLYVGYRVKAMRVRIFPHYVANVTGVAPPPALIAFANFSSGLSVTTYANMIDSAACRLISGYKPATFAVNWDKLTDAKLWTPNNAAISSTEAYGIVFIGASTNIAAQISTTYFGYVVEYDCEFITSA
jgi:hypothetical protein